MTILPYEEICPICSKHLIRCQTKGDFVLVDVLPNPAGNVIIWKKPDWKMDGSRYNQAIVLEKHEAEFYRSFNDAHKPDAAEGDTPAARIINAFRQGALRTLHVDTCTGTTPIIRKQKLIDFTICALRTWDPVSIRPAEIQGESQFWGPETYLLLGYLSELGEVASVVKRAMRDNKGMIDDRDLDLELGDLLWYAVVMFCQSKAKLKDKQPQLFHPAEIPEPATWSGQISFGQIVQGIATLAHKPEAALASALGLIKYFGRDFGIVCNTNIDKLAKRAAAGTIKGKGDHR